MLIEYSLDTALRGHGLVAGDSQIASDRIKVLGKYLLERINLPEFEVSLPESEL